MCRHRAGHDGHGLPARHGVLVDPLGGQGVEDVRHRRDPRLDRDSRPVQVIRIPTAVVAFMVLPDDIERAAVRDSIGCRELLAQLRVLLHDGELALLQLARFVQHLEGNSRLPKVVQDAANRHKLRQLGPAWVKALRQKTREEGDVQRVDARVFIPVPDLPQTEHQLRGPRDPPGKGSPLLREVLDAVDRKSVV